MGHIHGARNVFLDVSKFASSLFEEILGLHGILCQAKTWSKMNKPKAQLRKPCTWSIIPGLGYVVNNQGDRKSPKDRVVGPLLKAMAYKWGVILRPSWDDPPSRGDSEVLKQES